MSLPCAGLLCPVCREGLEPEAEALLCPNRHAFDVAREGYVNLLLSRRSRAITGDSGEMLRARRAFLGAGHYRPLSEAVGDLVLQHLKARQASPEPPRILDVGCGEGHYLAQLRRHLEGAGGNDEVRYLGMDVSKEAVRMAARANPGACLFVADVNRPWLLADGSMAILLDLFAPRNPAEFARVCAPGGLLLVAIPTPEHLAEPRARFGLLDIEPDKREHLLAQLEPGFALVKERVIQYRLELDGESLTHLLSMTPSYWHLPPEIIASAREEKRLSVGIGFRLLAFASKK